MTTPIELMANFLVAARGLLTPNLMKYSADLDGDKVFARIVVLDEIGEEELDYVLEIAGHLVGHIGGTADIELIRVETAQDTEATPQRAFLLYEAHSIEQQRMTRFRAEQF
jgi:hypothetical protein